jgi:ferrous iron transport protein B
MKLKILLVGQPNVGKSSLLNALVGPKVIVSNYPGTTVEVTRAKKTVAGKKIEFIDTPGTYSISDRSEEEKVTEKALFEKKANRAIIVADSSSLERSLYLAFQVLEAGIPTVLALNFVEGAKKKGITIDHKKLSKILGIPIIPINPLTKYGINKLINTVLGIKEIKAKAFSVRYDDDIEKAIKKISSQITKTYLPKRFVALRVLEEDVDFYKYLKDKEILKKAKEGLVNHPKVAEDITVTRFGTAAFIVREATKIVPVEEAARNLEERADRVLLHRAWGPFLTILTFVAIFGALLFLGSWMQNTLMGFTESFLSAIHLGGGFIGTALEAGLTGLMAGVSIALPYIFLFYILLTLVEDVGLLSRFVINLERLMRRFNLPGKATIPLALGLGCTVPGIRSTRILSSGKERFYTAALFTAVPCSSRTAIIMGIVGHFGGKWLAVSVLISLVVGFFIFAYLMKMILRLKKKPVLYELPELPPYRMPSIKNIAVKSWIRMKTFVYIVIPFLIVGGILYTALDTLGVTKAVVGPFSPIMWWLGLPAVAIVPWAFAYLQKDLSAAMLFTVLGTEIAAVLSPLQIYTFGVATTIGIPCMIATGMLWKEFGSKRAFTLTLISAAYGLLFAGLAWRIISIF